MIKICSYEPAIVWPCITSMAVVQPDMVNKHYLLNIDYDLVEN